MLPKIARMFLSIFDIHIRPTLMVQPSELGADLQFLATPVGYRSMREKKVPVLSAGFRIFPVDTSAEYPGFWKGYANSVGLVEPADCRDWLIPLRCRPMTIAPEFHIPGMAAPLRSYITVWLWPFGWSSQIELRIAGPMDFNQVESITSALYSKSAKPFTTAGAGASLSDIFKVVAARVNADTVAQGANSYTLPFVPRRMVVGLIGKQGEAFERFNAVLEGTSAVQRWSDSDRSRIVSLLGPSVGLTQVNEVKPSGSPYSTVDLGDTQTAVLHDQLGALLMLRHPNDTQWKRDGQLRLLGNIRASFMAWAALNGLINKVRRDPANDSLIQAAKDARRLSFYYPNSVFRQHVHEPPM